MEEQVNTEGYLELIQKTYRAQFSLFSERLLRENEKYNLTSITEEEKVLYKHFLDSVAGEGLFPSRAKVAEVGSGAGFPSIPLKIVRDDLDFFLFESTKKKCVFLRETVASLHLRGVRVFDLRAEEAGADKTFRESFDVCCARAVARLNVLSEYCLPLVKVGGTFLAYKGDVNEELEEAQRAIGLLGGKLQKLVRFSLPKDMGERTIVVVEKIKKTPQGYPRGRGKERKDPIR